MELYNLRSHKSEIDGLETGSCRRVTIVSVRIGAIIRSFLEKRAPPPLSLSMLHRFEDLHLFRFTPGLK